MPEIVIRISVPEGVTVHVDPLPAALPYHPVLEEAPWPAEVVPLAQMAAVASQSHAAPFVAPQAPNCPDGHGPMVYKPAGISKRTGAAYNAFWGCSDRNCKRTANS